MQWRRGFLTVNIAEALYRIAFFSVLYLLVAVPQTGTRADSTDALPPLIDAVINQDVGAARMLLETGADPNLTIDYGYSALHFAVGVLIGVPERQAERLSGRERPAEPTTILELLLRHGADPNVYSEAWGTPLTVAVFQGRNKSVSILLEAGANPDGAMRGWSPLMVAAYHCYPDIAVLLVDHGATKDFNDVPGRTALSLAEKKDCGEIIDLLSQ